MDNEKPRKVRQLTRFMAQELLYDYVSGSLDRSRQDAVEAYIPTCRETMRELERLRRGVDYTRALAQISVPEKILQSLESYEPRWQKLARRLTLWSAERGWRFVAPVFVFITFVLAIVVWSPWQQSVLTELARVEHTPPPIDPEFAPHASAVVDAASAINPTASPLAVPSTLREVGTPAATVVEPPLAAPGESAPAPFMGSVHRATFTVTGDIAKESEALRLKIMEWGGEMRPKGDRIFDFSLPESKLPDLEQHLTSFGPVRLKKDKRPQEMPAGRIRIILLLNENVAPAPVGEKAADTNPAESSPVEAKPAEQSPAAPVNETPAPVKDGSTNEGSSAAP